MGMRVVGIGVFCNVKIAFCKVTKQSQYLKVGI